MPANDRGGDTPSGENLPEQGHRKFQPGSVQVKVKRWCKRPPAPAVMQVTRQPPSGARPSRDMPVAGREEAARLQESPG